MLVGSKMNLRLNSLVFVICLCFTVFAQDHEKMMQKIDSLVNPVVELNSVIVFDYTEYNANEIKEDALKQTYSFEFTNQGKFPIVIVRITSSCGCVVADYDKNLIAVGARGKVSVEFNPKEYLGAFSRSIFVYTNNSTKPSAKLTIRGNVIPTGESWRGFSVILGEKLRARSDLMNFNNMEPGQIRSERIECVNTGTTDLQLKAITGLLPENIAFHTDPAIIGPGKTGDLVVTVNGAKAGLREGKIEKKVVFFTNLAGNPPRYKLNLEIKYK